MTRINLVPVEELSNKFLLAEYKEITRVYRYVRKLQISNRTPNIPKNYTLGTGHVTFFFDKLGYISNRYKELSVELYKRKFNINPISIELLEDSIDRKWFNNYTPTTEAIAINQERLDLRTSEILARQLQKQLLKKKK